MELIRRFYIIPILLVVFAILFILTYREVENKTIREFENQELIMARQAEKGIEGFFNYYYKELMFLSRIPHVQSIDTLGIRLLDDFYRSHSDEMLAISRITKDGILAYTYPFNQSGIEQSDLTGQPHIQELLATHEPVLSDIFTTVQGVVAIAYHIPVFHDGSFEGSIAILVPVDLLGKRFLGEVKLGKTGYAFMVSENLNELYCPLPGHSGNSIQVNSATESGLFEALEHSGVKSDSSHVYYHGRINSGTKKGQDLRAILYKVPLWNTYWTIVISIPEAEISASLKGFRNKLFLSSIFVLAVMLIYFYSYAKAGAILKEEKRRRAAEKALKESEERWSFALEGSGDGVWDRNMQTNEVFYSAQWKRLLGYENNELKNTFDEWYSRVHPEDLDVVLRLVDDHLKGKAGMYEAEYRMICKNGSYKWILDRGKVISRNENGEPIRIVGTHSDITERKKFEEQLQILWRAVDQSPASIIITDTQGRIEYVNRKFIQHTGYRAEEVLQQTHRNIKSGLVPDELYNELWGTITAGKVWVGEFQNRKKDGEVYWEKALISPVQNGNGEIVHYIAIMEDITEKKVLMRELVRARDKAEESDRLKSAFLQNMSHEIRTPMNAIMGFSELLEQEQVSDEERCSYISIIKESGEQLLSIVNNILTISFIDTRQEKVNMSRVDIIYMMKQLHSIFSKDAERRQVKLELDSDPAYTELECWTDATKLNQVLTNLISNSLKFTHKGFVRFGFRIKDSWLDFYVEDSGIGIDPKVQSKIFRRFNQADEDIRYKYGGTGLGLSISRAFVELLGGTIVVSSEPGKGSTFTFTIPFTREYISENTEKMTDKVEKSGRLAGTTILVAEDEEFNFKLIREFLKEEKVELIHAENGYEAVDIVKSDRHIDLVLMDIKMPELNGEKATRFIKELRPQVPVIAQSAYAIESEIRRYMSNGFDDYITKPIIQGELIDKCARALHR